MCGKNTIMNTHVTHSSYTMVTSNEHDMILFTTAHDLHIPIEYHQEDDVNVYISDINCFE